MKTFLAFWTCFFLVVMMTVGCGDHMDHSEMGISAEGMAGMEMPDVTDIDMSEEMDMSDMEMHTPLEVDASLPIPFVSITLHKDAMDGYNLQLSVDDFTLTPETINGENIPNTGHAHLHINGVKIQRVYGEWTHLSSKLFTEDHNTVNVSLNANDHSIWTLNEDEIGAEIAFSTKNVISTHVTQFPIKSDNLTYLFDWQSEPTTITNDLGYTISLDEAYLLNASLELVPCEDISFWDLFKAQTVYAGHGTSAISETRSLVAAVESLTQPQAQERMASASQADYCQVHYLVAPALDSAEFLPPITPSFIGKTISLSGTYISAESAEPIGFSIESALAWGGFLALPAPITASNNPVELHVQRDMNSLFDGIDFATTSADDQAKSILRNLINNATTTVTYP